MPPMITDTMHSPFARLQPISLTDVTLDDTIWAVRQQQNRTTILPYQYGVCESTGRIDNFRLASGKIQADFRGLFFNDSDVYKWLEAAAWALITPDAELTKTVDNLIQEIAAAQGDDGYLNTYFMFDKAAERWQNLTVMHELYCAGHLIQAAIAHQRTTKNDALMQIARRFADLICATFGADKRPGTDGHPEIEMALVELYRATGEKRYLEQAQYFLDARGYGIIGGAEYCQDDMPFRERKALAGHAVRALYLCAGAADIFMETGDVALLQTLETVWQHTVTRRSYVNGGIGSRHEGEAIGSDYELPNASGYGETCAAIASVMWNWRMLQITGSGLYADVMEHTLYNAVLPGVSLDGTTYFYTNPLANDGTHRRQPWFECACCPPNIARTLASLPGYCYSVSPEGVWVHLYARNDAKLTLPDGREIMLDQTTRYPWHGAITIELASVPTDNTFSLFLRIPAWCEDGARLVINSDVYTGELIPGTYLEIRRAWQLGDMLVLTLPMPVRRIESHPNIVENHGHVALQRGPILYCVEGVDQPNIDLDTLVLTENDFHADYEPETLSGVVVLRGHAATMTRPQAWQQQLYRTYKPARLLQTRVPLTAIPYFAWANRAAAPMRVWLRG